MVEASVVVTHQVGLHARPAALFVQTANRFTSTVRARNVTTGSEPVDAKSILGILTLGVLSGHEILVSAQGPDEVEALRALRALVEGGFVEGELQA